MDQETIASFGFFFIGIGFFLYVMHYLSRDENRRQEREHELALRRKPRREPEVRKRKFSRS